MDFKRELFTSELKEEFIYNRLKTKVYEFLMIRTDFNDYFDLGKFFRKYNIRKQADIDRYVSRILIEFQGSGWNCGTSFYKTGLFIFGETSPPNFFPDTNEF